MRTCFVVPGFAGSELLLASDGESKLWVSYTAIALGKIGEARLAADGTSPGSPDGVALIVGHSLTDYYSLIAQVLGAGLMHYGYKVEPFPYDWRQSFQRAGALLAAKIREKATPADPASIVAHSLGGLVARSAWALLLASGESNLLRRVVTLGTPHQGCYGPISLLSLNSEIVEQIRFMSGLIRVGTSPVGGPILLPAWPEEKIIALAATWPALYETFPVLGSSSANDDPRRATLFDAANWPADRGVSAAWLDHAKNVIGPFLLSAESFPPSWVLTTVAGIGVMTPDSLNGLTPLGQKEGIDSIEDGDGTVTLEQALVLNGSQIRVNSLHADLTVCDPVLTNVASWVLEERSNPAPPPLVEIIANPLIPLLNGPPLVQLTQGDNGCTGKCRKGVPCSA